MDCKKSAAEILKGFPLGICPNSRKLGSLKLKALLLEGKTVCKKNGKNLVVTDSN